MSWVNGSWIRTAHDERIMALARKINEERGGGQSIAECIVEAERRLERTEHAEHDDGPEAH
jgi:hypothetical protein